MAKTGLSYTERTIAALKMDPSVFVGKTEHWNPFGGGSKPTKKRIVDTGGSSKYGIADLITKKEFEDENAQLAAAGKALMVAKDEFDGKFGLRQDLFGFIDIIALYPNDGKIVGIQSTGPSGFYSHLKKIREECRETALAWLKSGGQIQLWSWEKKKPRPGVNVFRWTPKIQEITLAMLETEPVKPAEDKTIQTAMEFE